MSFLTGVQHLDLDLDMVTGCYYTLIQILAFYLDFENAKNISVLFKSSFGTLEDVGGS